MELDAFSLAKQFLHVGNARVAFADQGEGSPVLLLHGCPFSSFIWRNVIPPLARAGHRCVAPDLLGLGDTETPPDADWSLPAQVAMVTGLLDTLGLERVHIVGHDHGGAIAQLLAAGHPDRIDRLVLCNTEAYDNWPSGDERPFVIATQLPVIGALFRLALSSPRTFKLVLRTAKAVNNPSALTDELVAGYVRANLSDPHKRAKTARFLAGQLDPDNNRHTLQAIDGLRRCDRPSMLLWGTEDPHFGPEWADRLATDIAGVCRKELLRTGHLVMEEQPDRFATLLVDFLKRGVIVRTHDPPFSPGQTST
jgi:pimeloyl-ACP methyl ester carboxylesterase